MKIGCLKETAPGEQRVALVPETAQRLVRAKHQVLVESKAGGQAGFGDEAFVGAGAQILADAAAVRAESDILVHVQRPTDNEIATLKKGAVLVALLNARSDPAVVQKLAAQGVSAFAMELVPRIARAQRLDVLSSQASIAGYKAVLLAASSLGKYFPMLMTAAGTVPPAKVLVLGAGVAGLQAIATARRLGAMVEAYDVRLVVKEQVESLGAKFIQLPQAAAEGQGGYAREQSAEEQARQRELLKTHIAASDVVITTAAVPGRKAPLLVTDDMIVAMRPGSVIVDLAAETGGNVSATKAGETVQVNGVAIQGPVNVPASMPWHASLLYSRNVMAFLDLITNKEGQLALDFNDEIVSAMCVAHGGEVRLK